MKTTLSSRPSSSRYVLLRRRPASGREASSRRPAVRRLTLVRRADPWPTAPPVRPDV